MMRQLGWLFAVAMPVEIVQFCWKYNLQRLQNLPEVKGCTAKLRKNDDDSPYVTDNSNYIVDLYFETPIQVCMLMADPPCDRRTTLPLCMFAVLVPTRYALSVRHELRAATLTWCVTTPAGCEGSSSSYLRS